MKINSLQRRRKQILLVLILCYVAVFSMSLVAAEYGQNVTDKAVDGFASGGSAGSVQTGAKLFTGNNPIAITGFSKSSLVTATKGYIYWANRTLVANANASFSGTFASFGTNVYLPSNTYFYTMVDSQGAAYNWAANTSGFTTSPLQSTNVQWIAGFHVDQSNHTNEMYVTQNITTQLYYAPQGWNLSSYYFNPTTTEGNIESYQINITYNSTVFPNDIAYLVYNGTTYTSTKTNINGNSSFVSTIAVPAVTGNTIHNFYWNIGMINSSGTIFYSNSSTYGQYTYDMGIDNCTLFGNKILNYSMKDEFTQSLINETLFNNSIQVNTLLYSLNGNVLVMNFSGLYNRAASALVCINSTLNSSEYSLYSTAEYSADNYVTRRNYIQNFSISNQTLFQNINLFDISLDKSPTKFLLTYKDSNFLAVLGALVSIDKQYVSEGTFKTVEIEQTNDAGQTTGWFDLNGRYTIIVTKNGQLLSTFNNVIPYCESAVTGDCKISLDASYSFVPSQNFYTYNNIYLYPSFNQTSRIYSLLFNTVDGSVTKMGINLTNWNQNETICYSETTTSSGSLSCLVASSYGNITFAADIYKDNVLISQSIYTIESGTSAAFEGNLVIFVFGIVLSIAIMFVPSPAFVIIGTLVGTGISFILFFLGGASGFGLGGLFILLVIAAILIIWRMRQGGSD